MKGVPKELDHIVDQVLAYNPNRRLGTQGNSPISVESWSVLIDEIFKSSDLRLDATRFNLKAAQAVKGLHATGGDLRPLSSVASVALPNQFTRIWAQDDTHGRPYLNATDLLSLVALGVPAGGQRYLSHATETNIEGLVIREGWLLMTCSGTIGRVFYVPKRLDGWVATHDLIRIVPTARGITGYLFTWFSTPEAQSQILSYTHGGQIDHVTADQVSDILVPIPDPKDIKAIHRVVMKALRTRELAIQAIMNVRSPA